MSEGMIKICSTCGAELFFDRRPKYSIIYYKFCPKCGAHSNKDLPTKMHSIIYKWSPELLGIILPLAIVIWFGYPAFMRGFSYPGDIKDVVIFSCIMIGIPQIAYLPTRLYLKSCPSCNELNQKAFIFCRNCGKKLTEGCVH